MGDLKNELQKMLEELELRKKKLSSLDFKQNQYVVLFKPVKGEVYASGKIQISPGSLWWNTIYHLQEVMCNLIHR